MYQAENSRCSFVEEISLWINFSFIYSWALKKKTHTQEIYLISLGINFNVQIYFQMLFLENLIHFPIYLFQTYVYIIKPTSFEKY